jgi:N-hydroxyarylamine O-acetyltransferase
MDPAPDIDAYARRIGLEAALAPTLETLGRLVERHAATIPFENIDVLAGRVPRLDVESLQAKLVHERRGGWCFEQNGFFLAVLRRVGFDAHGLEAPVRSGVPADVVTARSHMAVCVRVDGIDHLVDVGFGGLAPTAPLPLEERVEQPDGIGRYRFLAVERDRLLQCLTSDGWTDCYRILPSAPQPIDYEMANWWTATHPSAFLRHNLLVARSVARGRLTLFNRTLSLRTGPAQRSEEQTLATRAEIADALADAFGLDIAPADLDAVMAVLERHAA